MSILRIYDPDECDPHGIPLDWKHCRACMGTGDELEGTIGDVPLVGDQRVGLKPGLRRTGRACATCGGHGSLKDAALFGTLAARCGVHTPEPTKGVRCEGCGHPMSEGTWEGATGGAVEMIEQAALTMLMRGTEPSNDGTSGPVHHSACDEGCRHSGPVRVTFESGNQEKMALAAATIGEMVGNVPTNVVAYEASWRQVDVRTLGWVMDLRPEKLAVLCLRCAAERERRSERP